MTNDEKRLTLSPGAGTPQVAQAVGEDGRRLVRTMLQTKEVRELVTAALPEVLEAWASGSRLRRLIAGIAIKAAAGGFKSAPAGGEVTLSDVLNRPENARALAEMAPGLVNKAVESAEALFEGIEGLAPEEKARLTAEILGKLDLGGIGRLLTSLARTANQAHAADPSLLTDSLRPVFSEWVKNTDFGELKEAVDNCSEGATALAGMVNEELWRYPAKMLTLMSMIPPAANAGIKALNSTLKPINNLAPDLLSDVLLSLVREADAQEMARLVNGLAELVRQFHTGSVLIGDQGRPMAPKEFSELAVRVLDSVDVPLLLKARLLLDDISEATGEAICKAIEREPELVREVISARFRRGASAVRRLGRLVDTVEGALSDEEVAGEISKGIAGVDAQELAATLGRIFSLLNRASAHRPGVLREAMSQVTNSLDRDETRDAAARIIGDVVVALKPIAPEIMPPVVKGFAELISAGAGDQNPEMREAVAALRKALAAERDEGVTA